MDDWRTVKTNKSLIHCFLLGWRRGFRGDLTSFQIQDRGDVHVLPEQSEQVSNEAQGGLRVGRGGRGDLVIHPDFHGLAQ